MRHHQAEILQSQDSQRRDKDTANYCPFVKWAGGKTQLLQVLSKNIPFTFNRYFEPFLGGGAMFFHLFSSRNLQFSSSYLSDINEDLITAYKVVKDKVEELIILLKHHEIEYKKSPRKYYYELRANMKPLTDVEKAARFITLNKTCYNGLYRVNSKGIFNVPIGRYKSPVICDSTNLRKASIALRDSKTKIQVNDYKDILLEKARMDDFIYLDPPYNPMSTTSYFTGYTHTGFGNEDQEELAHVFEILNNRKCKVLLSNSDTPFIRGLYREFADCTKEVDTIRAINSIASKRLGHKELLIHNYLW
jgi:DNA adenine methylase